MADDDEQTICGFGGWCEEPCVPIPRDFPNWVKLKFCQEHSDDINAYRRKSYGWDKPKAPVQEELFT